MADDLDEVLALKASAKSARADGDWEGAIVDLQDAIEILDELRVEAGPSIDAQLASELADTYGMVGGVERRWALTLDGPDRRSHLERSVAAYDAGFMHERTLDRSEASTYSRINRLISRVLLDPQILEEGHARWRETMDELREAEAVLVEQLASFRQKDPWGYCDLGTVRLLLGGSDALTTFHDLDSLRPPAFVYESTLATIEPLTEVASDLRPELRDAAALLRRGALYGSE